MFPPTMDPPTVPPAPPLLRQNSRASQTSNRSTQSSRGFRLLDDVDPIETGSIYSVYKQKIDKMFIESDSPDSSNTVQAKIERMFSEVAYEEGMGSDLGSHTFSIDYLGSVPLTQKVTSLSGLQVPLKELYFAYKKTLKHKTGLTGKLEISSAGLKVRYQGDKGDLEQLNPFPTIAVWSAVKFVLHKKPKSTYAFLPLITDPDNIDKQSLFQSLDETESRYIVNQGHAPLFTVVMRKIGLHKQLECHGFICQTSEDAIVIAATLYKSLMGHMKHKDRKPKNKNGVSCMSVSSSTFADSITNPVPVRPPRKKRSTTSSVISETDTITHSDLTSNKPIKKSVKSRKAPTVPLPTSNTANLKPQNYQPKPSKSLHDQFDEILPYEEPTTTLTKAESVISVAQMYSEEMADKKRETIESTSEPGDNNELKRTRSVRRRSEDGIMVKSGDNSGDILTKVTIPRSGSFLNAGGLTRYKSKVNRTNGLTSGGSPLGFSELFAEFRLQENLHSLDDILGAIVKPEGMSFNDLKPIYKEFLLKLAVTLTKDELYQRAKCIMRRKKRRERKGKSVGVGVQKLKRVFRKSFRLNISRKLKKKKQLKNLKSSSSFEAKSCPPNVPESSISTSSYDTRQFRPKDSTVQRKQSYRKRNSDIKEANLRIRRERMSTSEDSDFFTMKRRKDKCSPSNQNRNSSSGYVSCSECSYDSDTCTCISADKCYCSLGNRFSHRQAKPRPHSGKSGDKPRPDEKTRLQEQKRHPRPLTASSCRSCRTCDDRCYCSLDPALQTLTWCGCETDTCTESEKCYCQGGRGSRVFEEMAKKEMSKETRKLKKGLKKTSKFDPKNRIFEELQRKGFFPMNEEKVNQNPAVKTSKKYKKKDLQKQKQCTDKYCFCPDNFCLKTNFEEASPPTNKQIANKSYLHSSSKPRQLERPLNNNSYDQNPSNCQDCENCNTNGTIFEQLQRRGFIPSCEEMTTPPNERKLCKKNSNTRSTKSVEYVPNPQEKYYEKLQTRYYEDETGINTSQRRDGRRRSVSENNLMETELFRGKELYGRAMSEVAPRNGFMQNSVRSFKSFNGNHRRSTTGNTLQTSIPPTSSTEALSVKKSAEIAALFTDLKLSQTTDITHILPANFPLNSSNSHQFPLSSSNSHQFPLSSSNSHQFPLNSANCQIRPRQFHVGNNVHNDKKAIVTPYKHISSSGKMIQNTLYQGRLQSNGKNGLYSARNGLYTIQSQSDSSCSENQNNGMKKTSSNLENTLGYLP